jgi:hypothetical protein
MLHQATGSMPEQPIKDRNTEEIITPVEKVVEEGVVTDKPSTEEEIVELSDDIPTDPDVFEEETEEIVDEE